MTGVSRAPASRGPASRAGETLFVPRPRGFAASLLGIDPAAIRWNREALIEAARKDQELLRGDLAVVTADPTVLVEAWGCSVEQARRYDWRVTAPPLTDPAAWAGVDPPDPVDSKAFATAVAAAALGRALGVVVAIPTPVTLALQMAGRHRSPSPADVDWDALLDACGVCVADAAKPVLVEAGAHLVLLEDLTGADANPGELAGYCTTLANVLRHHGATALIVVTGAAHIDPYRELGVVAAGDDQGETPWDEHDSAFAAWAQDIAARPVSSPVVPAGASPERVQHLVRLVEERRKRA